MQEGTLKMPNSTYLKIWKKKASYLKDKNTNIRTHTVGDATALL